ncbi:Phage tail protein [Comamonas aquatilis]|uniref:hypothetical protein n=1 Tax=Comamonas aquatilis TaxID=1778406 RepID=UPI0039EF1E67
MASIDLVFNRPFQTGNPVELAFGDDGGGTVIPDAQLVMAARLPGLRARALVHVRKDLLAAGRMPGVRCQGAVRYNTDTPRPVVAQVQASAQQAQPFDAGWRNRWQKTHALPAGWTAAADDARPLRAQLGAAWQNAQGLSLAKAAAFEQAQRLAVPALLARWQEGRLVRVALRASAQDGVALQSGQAVRFQEALRDRRLLLQSSAQDAVHLQRGISDGAGPSLPLHLGQLARYQQAMKPPPGCSDLTPPKPPEPERCYEQLTGGPIALLFCKPWAASTDLLFVCCKAAPQLGAQFVIPLLKVYMTVHTLEAQLLPSGEAVVLTNVTIASDDDGFGWSLSASGPEHLLDQLAPVGGLPARIRVTVDGIAFVFAVQQLSRSRRFGQRSVALQGASVTALLGAPYMPAQIWHEAQPATAQQLLLKVLEYTGVSLDWRLSDWLVPGGVWSHQGTPLSAVRSVVGAVGAVLRSHPVNEQLIIAPSYPVAPWDWGGAQADVQMPAAVITTDELRPEPRAPYNAIYVAGGRGGVLGHVRRAGTAGELLARQVSDPLITDALAARQRGLAELAASGNKLIQSITLPLLTGGSQPGLIRPGQLLQVDDTDGTWRGLVKGTRLSAAMPVVRQQLTVERVAA